MRNIYLISDLCSSDLFLALIALFPIRALQREMKLGAAVVARLHPDAAAVRFDDRAADRQAQPHAPRLGADEGGEQSSGTVGGHAGTGIGDDHPDETRLVGAARYGQPAPRAIAHRLTRIAAEVEQHL